MNRYYAILIKEFLQVIRDLPGLALLFLMPALMLIVITMTQEKQLTGTDSGMKILLVNNDSSSLGNSIEKELKANAHFKSRVYASEKEAEEAVFRGDYQIVIIVPKGSTEKLQELAWQHASDTTKIKPAEIEKLSGITLLYDPALLKIFKDMLISSLQMITESTAAKIYIESYSEALKTNIAGKFEEYKKRMITTDFEREMPDFPGKQQVIANIRYGLKDHFRDSLSLDVTGKLPGIGELVNMEVKLAGNKSYVTKHSLVDNNVPAFILFAMFFIVVSLSGSILNEKQMGTRARLMTMPVSKFTLISGKITIFLIVCMSQFFVMIFIGKYIFPLISSLPPISLDVNIVALMAIAVASALAAIGFGLLIGTICSTFGQAAPIGSVVVVILAILGGIFVPSFMMPDIISKISIISPLRWGTDAFLSIFARGAGIVEVAPQLLALLVFFGVSLFISINAFTKRK